LDFTGTFNNHYSDMLKLRESLGYSASKNPQPVSEFIAFCGKYFADSEIITKDMVDKWLHNKVFRKNTTHNHAVSKIRVFARYLESIGVSAYVPDEDYSVRRIRYSPYIFTDDELVRLFGALDCIPPHYSTPNLEHIVPVLYRMMYCCGMRPSEPPSLFIEDVNVKSGEVYIRQAKGHKDRRILMSPDLTDLCREYASRVMPQKYFFERSAGSRISSEWVVDQFHRGWRCSGLQKRGNPRPYDLRHNFATRTILRWLKEGRNFSALMPYLSAYMGHADFSDTYYYIHLIPERLQQNPGVDWARFSCIYPKVHDA